MMSQYQPEINRLVQIQAQRKLTKEEIEKLDELRTKKEIEKQQRRKRREF